MTSDDPGTYTDEMIRRYKEYRRLTEATDVSITTGGSTRISYTLDGRRQSRRIF